MVPLIATVKIVYRRLHCLCFYSSYLTSNTNKQLFSGNTNKIIEIISAQEKMRVVPRGTSI